MLAHVVAKRSAVKLAPSLSPDDVCQAFPDAIECVQVGSDGECKAWIVISDHAGGPDESAAVTDGSPVISALIADHGVVIQSGAGQPAGGHG